MKNIFSILNNFFDNIYLITLKRSKNRHARIDRILDGLNYEVFWGIDGSKLNIDHLQEEGLYDSKLTKTKIPFGQELTKGEIGCALSHLDVYKDMRRKGYRNALILEDDVKIEIEDVQEELSNSIAELPEDWELFYLGYLYNNSKITLPILFRIIIAYPMLNLLGKSRYDAHKLRCKFPRPYSKHLDIPGYHYGTHAYAVSAAGARKILAYQKPISMATDNAVAKMCMEESIKGFRMTRRIFHQNRKLPSTIKGR